MSNELVKQEVNLPQTSVTGGAETFLASDIVLPRVLLMQGLSKLVGDRKAIMGDIVRSTNAQKLADDKSSIGIIPLTYRLSWINEELIGGKKKFRSTEERNASNEGLPWEYMKDGANWYRTKAVEAYVLLSQDIEDDMGNFKEGEVPDLNKVLVPSVITFRSTSYNAGREYINHFMKVSTIRKKLPNIQPYNYEMQLTCVPKENEKGKFFVYFFQPVTKQAKVEHVAVAAEWYATLSAGLLKFKVDEEESEMEPTGGDENAF